MVAASVGSTKKVSTLSVLMPVVTAAGRWELLTTGMTCCMPLVDAVT
ncbi:MAG TPA: hypothetical protein VF658_19280 [Pyrinomonadaceae bacterium]|jgi:hypothetical protein